MEINDLLKGFDCPCGKRHTCDIDAVYIEKGAISRLEGLCAEYDTVLVVSDENTFAAAGGDVLKALGSKSIKQVTFSGRELLIPDEKAVCAVEENLASAEIIIGVGSGVIQDLCKYVSFKNGVPYIIAATAPSMDGYASDGAAMITGGMKVTYPACLPRAIIADTEVLAAAPDELIKSGFGDIIGKFSALSDWKLSRCVNGEYFCDKIYDLTLEQVNAVIPLAGKIINEKDESSIAGLMSALVMIGILMSFAGSSRPASGSEHHLAHFFEITGITDKKPYFSHGINVAFSSYLTAKIYGELRDLDFSQAHNQLSEADAEIRLSEVFGRISEQCLKNHRQSANAEAERIKIYRLKENELRAILAQMPSAEKMLEIISSAQLDINDFYNMYGQEKLNNAVLFAKDLKSRFTVLWIYYDLLSE